MSERLVALFEDDGDSIDYLNELLNNSGFSVAGVACNMKEAESLIGNLGDLGVRVAIVDGNLREGNFSNKDGRDIVCRIREVAPEVKSIGRASMGTIEEADFNVERVDPSELILLSLLEEIFS